MHWIPIFLFKLTVLPNAIYIYAKLSPEDSSKSAEMLSYVLSPYHQNFTKNGHLHNDNDLNGIDLQLVSNGGHQYDIKTYDKRGNHKNDDNDSERRRAESERGDAGEQKSTKEGAKVTEAIEEKEYLQNNTMYKYKEFLTKQRNNNNNNSNYHKTTTKTSNKKQTNTLSEKATMVTKANAGLSMRVKNDLHKVDDINETSRNRTETTTNTIRRIIATTPQNTKQASLTSIGRDAIVGNKGRGAVLNSAKPNATQEQAVNTKLYYLSGFLNPFGQLVAFFGSDQLHLQDYTLFFNAERHTVFQLHTNNNNNNALQSTVTTGSGRVLNVAPDSFVSAFGANAPTADISPVTPYHSSSASSIIVEEVQLYNGKSLRQSRFSPFNPTRILIHGWFGGANAGVYQTLVPTYLQQGAGNYNVFTVDWGRGAVADYITASYRVKPVGKVLAKFIDFLQREAGIRYEDLHVIGFSMGAHIAGIAGKHIQTGRLPVIYALDPALPFFRYENFDERIAITDADYVEVVHTSVGSYGYDQPLGHVDFYVNYGSAQPGCFFNECSHFRAFQIFAESLQGKHAFRAQGCDVKLWQDMIKHRRCSMGTGRQMLLGGDPTNVMALRGRGGVFYLATNAVSPYAKDVT
ncbi:uncharacterized protein LOC129239480 [Anastrepha obliqua]|uniref:uncharacterized protein LOC129239480 n=1 Tax=Anastrepha obliqua TaxID=95512 RepID=UPI00240933AD|nr:uncharacterized protein LOC129239480 [Anastrepha obliqua]